MDLKGTHLFLQGTYILLPKLYVDQTLDITLQTEIYFFRSSDIYTSALTLVWSAHILGQQLLMATVIDVPIL